MTPRTLVLVFIVLSAPLFSPADASACDCHDGGAVCEAFWKAPVVFTGRVESVRRWTSGGRVQGLVARFRVFETLRGPKSSFIELVSGNTSCDLGYRVGDEWLIYASRTADGQKLYSGTCSRSTPLRGASEDLAYIRSANAAAQDGKGRIFGEVRYSTQTGPQHVSGARVTLTGDRQVPIDAVTDERGRYEVPATPGHYQVTAALPPGMSLEYVRHPTLLDSRGCAVADLFTSYPATASGVVVDADDVGIPNATVEMLNTDQQHWPPHGPRAMTDTKGRFTVPGLEPGKYAPAIVIGYEPLRIGGHSPRFVFIGNATERPAARHFVLAGGTRQDVGRIQLPRDVRLVQVRGAVQRRDGTPAANVRVGSKVDFDDWDFPWTTVTTDAQGQFQFAMVAGMKYRIFANSKEHSPTEVRTTIDPVRSMPLVRLTLKE